MNPEAAPPHATTGPVHIVGAGLIGASVGLGLRQLGLEVTLEDPSPAAAAVAEQVGAGRRRQPKDPEPQVVVVAVPPDVTANVVAQALARFSAATVTDAASVKAVILEELTQLGADLSRYVGSHPMAGRERSGPAAGSGDLFVGRPWVITANPATAPERVLQIRHLATDLGAHPTFLDAATHDTSVALVSHLPQILSSLTAARLVQAEAGALDLAGQGLRDVTRIAGSDPELWSAILVGNGPAVAAVLREVQADLAHAIGALEMGTAPATLGQSLKTLADLVAQGRRGAERIPGKHGGARRQFDRVTVMVPDRPGALGELFQEMGRLGVNLEDLKLEHGMGQLVGLAEVWVPLGQGAPLAADLEEQGWRILK
ncbi:MAG: prephenate dehydrogenase [Bifidobacteriaceae bacterium]|jgi:prephenate dehydrogenase|nr:prephenate dehydrogenase [Bifidobacteriaceae bacterium]